MADAEKHVLRAALAFHHGNKSQTAQHLDISVRTIDNKLAEYGKQDAETEAFSTRTGISREHQAMLDQKRQITEAVEREESARRNGVEPASQMAPQSGLPVREQGEVQEVLPLKDAASNPQVGGKSARGK